MKHVLIYLVNGDCYSIGNCVEIYSPSSDPKYVRIETGKKTYVFNMNSVEHIEIIAEDEKEEQE